MKVSLNWARDIAKRYQNFELIDVPTDELVKLATERLGGLEGYEEIGKRYDGIVVAKIVSCQKHSNADKLKVCLVDDNNYTPDVNRDEDGYVQVICGAPNAREGTLVAWIPPGSTVPASYDEKELFILDARELRGEISNGMLASPKELGISEDHTGILEIEEDVEPGTPFKELFGLDDVILEIENKMFTHRPDCFGQLGVARELAGIEHKAFTSPDWYLKPLAITQKSSNEVNGLSVTVKDGDLCPRYMAVVIDNVTIKPSPIWLQSYLKRLGVRPINNVVDITNYIMLETAQPLHAFDFDKVARFAGHPERSDSEVEGSANEEVVRSLDSARDDKHVNIIVRRPKPNEKMTLLDGKEIQPHKDAVLICDDTRPIALGGVMGGGNSEIDENTKRVVLECATFNMYNIRRTSMIHGIFTDAVTRFTKGQPAGQLPAVIAKTIQMFEEIVGANATSEIVDVIAPTGNESPSTNHDYIELSSRFINERLGSKLSDKEIVKILNNVELAAHEASGLISVTPPFWRTDIEIPEDIVEEVGRLYGFNQLPLNLPKRDITPVQPDSLLSLKQQIRQILARAGANEVLNYSFVHGDLLKKAGQDPARAFALRNALSPDLQYYRLSLLPSLLDKVHANIKAGYDEFVLFEIGKTHSKYPDDEPGSLPDEYNTLEVVYTSSKAKQGAAYYQILKYVGYLLSDLGIPYRLEKPAQNVIENPANTVQAEKPFDMNRSAYMYYEHAEQGGMIGLVGELEQSVIKSFKLPEYTAAAIFALDGASFQVEHRQINNYTPLSKYPSSEQDLTLQVAADLAYADLENEIKKVLTGSEYDWQLRALSMYQAEGSVTKNLSFRITLSHPGKTLTTNEVNELVKMIVEGVKAVYEAEQV